MPFHQTGIKDLILFEPKIFEDERGFFMESYNKSVFEKEANIQANFVQDNRSLSHKGVVRGLHMQIGAFAQAKLVTVLKGAVIDIAVDLRKESETFGKSYAVELNAATKWQLFVPRGFGHGFIVLEDNTEFFYKCDNFYSKENERGVHFFDEELGIECPIHEQERLLSPKDKALPPLKEILQDLYFS